MKQLLKERFQQLAGIKPLYDLNEQEEEKEITPQQQYEYILTFAENEGFEEADWPGQVQNLDPNPADNIIIFQTRCIEEGNCIKEKGDEKTPYLAVFIPPGKYLGDEGGKGFANDEFIKKIQEKFIVIDKNSSIQNNAYVELDIDIQSPVR
jgi:hypothetical protein